MRKKIEIIGLIALLILITNCNSIIQDNADGKPPAVVVPAIGFSWPMYGHDPAHTGYSNSTAPSANFTFLEKQIQFFSSPIFVDGKLYGSGYEAGSEVTCYNAYNGELLWHKPITPAWGMTPTVVNGCLYIIDSSASLLCLNATTGATQWASSRGFAIGQNASLNVVDGKIYLGTRDRDHKLYCINTDGTEAWNFTAAYGIYSTPAVADGKVYFVASNSGPSEIYCVDANTGNHLWNYTRLTATSTTPVVAYGRVFIGSGNELLCLDATGYGNGTTQLYWSFQPIQLGEIGNPAVAYNNVYFRETAGSGRFYCVNADTGVKVWNLTISGSMIPAVADEKVYIDGEIGSDYYFYCFNANNGTEVWRYQLLHGYPVNIQPAIADGRVWITTYEIVGGSETGGGVENDYVYGFFDHENTPPGAPDKPSGTSTGLTGTLYTYCVNLVIDPQNDQVFYLFDWGDGTTSGWATQSCTSHQWIAAGTYSVKVKAKDYYGAESSWSPSLTVVITGQPTETPLEIVVASSVLAKHSFIITVTADDVAVALASVTFNGETQTTDSSGQVTFTAPETTGSYPVLASKSGYQSASETVTVLSTGENTQEGLLYGLITDDAKKPLSGVSICAINAETGTTVKCVTTDTKGNYMISIPMGSYTIIANKQGYEPSTKLNQNVQLNLAIEVNFRLSQKQEAPTDDTTKSFIEDAISTKIQLGEIGAKANVISSEEHTISSYIEGLNLDVNSAEETVRFTVNAPNGTQGTILVFHIGEGVLSDLNNVILTYDNASITEENDVAAFFDMHNSTDPAWLRVATNSGLYIFVRVPHFSTHTITISSVVGAFGGPNAILFYLAIAVIVALLFIGSGEITKRL